jgi:hypothetical protein
MKPKLLFWSRVCSILIDLSVVYSFSLLLQLLIWKFTFIDFPVIFASTFLFYYLLCYLFFKGKTLAKYVTKLSVTNSGNRTTTVRTILMREFLLKWFIGVIVPFFIIKLFFSIWSVLYTVIAGVIVFLISALFLLVVKRQWWEAFSGTITIRDNSNPPGKKTAFMATFLFIISGILVTNYSKLANFSSAIKDFIPHYPVTKEVRAYTQFIKQHKEDPVDYVFDLFKTHDIVVLSERIHSEYSQYELIKRIVADKRFTDNVGNLFTECGSVSFQDSLTTYLHSSFDSESALNKATAILQRNSNAVWPLWSNTNLFDLLQSVNKINSKLQDSSKINWYFTDLPVDWRVMNHQKFLNAYTNPLRDSLMAVHILLPYNKNISIQKRRKALVIMNTRHGYGLLDDNKNVKFAREYLGTTAYLMKFLPGKVANVFLNSISIQYGYIMTPVQNGKWDRAFALAGNPNTGFNFAGSPFGEDQFDAAFFKGENVLYKDVFTGFIFYQPLTKHFQKNGFPFEFEDFQDTILKRASYISTASVESYRAQIKHYTQYPNDRVMSDPLIYAVVYNLVNIGLSIVLLLNLIIAFLVMIFQRNPNHRKEKEVHVDVVSS